MIKRGRKNILKLSHFKKIYKSRISWYNNDFETIQITNKSACRQKQERYENRKMLMQEKHNTYTKNI